MMLEGLDWERLLREPEVPNMTEMERTLIILNLSPATRFKYVKAGARIV